MNIFIISVFIGIFFIAIAKRITALITAFLIQSFFLFLSALALAVSSGNIELYIIAALVLLLKVFLIPYFLRRIAERIQIDENLGLLINPLLSLIIIVLLSGLAYFFAKNVMHNQPAEGIAGFAISLAIILTGFFIMIFRAKAIAQVIGLLVMENGIFLAAAALGGKMPFIVEIAIFLDILVCAIILGVFIYRINELFTHIDTDKLTTLKG